MTNTNHTNVEQVIEDAIDTGAQLVFNYHGSERHVTPEDILVSRGRNRILVAIQTNGEPGYRRFSLGEIDNLRTVN